MGRQRYSPPPTCAPELTSRHKARRSRPGRVLGGRSREAAAIAIVQRASGAADQPAHRAERLGASGAAGPDGPGRSTTPSEARFLRKEPRAKVVVDDNGNLTDDATRVLVWDAFNRLVAVARKSDGAAIAAYSYLPDGRRSRKVVFSQTNPGVVEREVRSAWDGAQEVEEQNAAGVTLATFVWSPVYVDELVEFRREAAHPLGAGSFYAHQDVRCDVVAVTNASGVVVEKRRYDDFGREEIRDASGAVVTASPSGLEYGFQGRKRDSETGWLYFRARFYDPETGRFLSRDPVWDALNVGNAYTFGANNPATLRDPTGRFIPLLVIAIAAAVSVAASDQVAQEVTQYNEGVSTAQSLGESAALGAAAGALTYTGGAAAGALAPVLAPGFEVAGATVGTLAAGAGGIETGAAAGLVASEVVANMAVAAGTSYLLTGEVSGTDVAVSGALSFLGPAANALGKAKPSWTQPMFRKTCPPPPLGPDASPAEGLTAWRNVHETHPDIDLAREGLAEPWGTTRDAAPDVRALGHDQGTSGMQGSGFTAWSVDESFAMGRQGRIGGVVIETQTPPGSVWMNDVARGAESQVLIPGLVQGNVVAGGATGTAHTVPPIKSIIDAIFR